MSDTDVEGQIPGASARETAGATTRLVVGYVRERAGEEGVGELLRRARVDRPLAELEDDASWSGYDERIRLFEAATEITGEPDAMFEVGASALRQSVNPSLVLLLRALGSPRTVFKQLARAVPKFTTASTMEVLEAGATYARCATGCTTATSTRAWTAATRRGCSR